MPESGGVSGADPQSLQGARRAGSAPPTAVTGRRAFRTLEIIFKISERCNLACPYCYYFFMGDETAKQRPPLVQDKVAEKLVEFVRLGRQQLDFESVKIVFHGGEPMMLPRARFEALCSTLREGLAGWLDLELAIQTNGTLMTEEWVDLFDRHDVSVGISIDGDRATHDRNRIDVHGKGSYDRILEGIHLLRTHADKHDRRHPAAITVLDAANDYSQIARHLASDLGILGQSYLLPDCNHDDGIPAPGTAEDYGRALCHLFDFALAHPDVKIREVELFLRRFQRARYVSRADGKEYQKETQIIVVCSNGEVQVDDTFIPTGSWRKAAPKCALESITLKEWLDQPFFDEIEAAYDNPPSACRGCRWLNVCNGGDLENRYSAECGFNNPSVFCNGLKIFYQHAVDALIANGYPEAVVNERLHDPIDFREGQTGFAH